MKTKHKLTTQSFIQAQLTDALYRNLPSSLLALFCVASIIYWVLYDVIEEKKIFTWYVGLCSILILRGLLFLWYNRTNTEKNLQKYHYYLFVLGSTLTGLFLGVLGSFLMPSNIMYQAFIIILICGVIAGAAQSLSASFLAYIVYLYLTLFPLLIWEFIQILNTHPIYIGIFVGMIIFCIFSSITARREYLMVIRHIELEKNYKTLLQETSRLKNSYKQQATHDKLTTLYNRQFLDQYLTTQLEVAKRQSLHVAVIMLDIDFFKKINDTYGHEYGDEVLQELSKKLLERLRKSDAACRYGGEEFIVVLPDSSINAARHVAESLRNVIKTICIQKDNVFINNLSASFGIAIFPFHGLTGSKLIESADKAMYRAKAEGRDRVYIMNGDIPTTPNIPND